MEVAWAQVDSITNSAILAIYRKCTERRLPDRVRSWKRTPCQEIADSLQEELCKLALVNLHVNEIIDYWAVCSYCGSSPAYDWLGQERFLSDFDA